MRLIHFTGLIYAAVTWQACTGPAGRMPADKEATPETRNLYRQLHVLTDSGVMFGHQDDMAYGTAWQYEYGRSDVRESCGDGPAVYGWDLGHLELGEAHNLDSVPFDSMRTYIRRAFENGAVNTLSWHADNPVSRGSSWDTTRAVPAILPGGEYHQVYTAWLDNLSAFLHSLKTSSGTPVPIIFRPFHEHTGSWFWWGQRHCTTGEYKALWRFTVDYLREEKQVHNLLYAYSPAQFSDSTRFLERYPGDKYVDIMGVDIYQYGQDSVYIRSVQESLQVLETLAATHGKISALTETGYEGIPDPNWWTQVLLPALNPYRVSYVLVWRNARNIAGHYYAPYPGHVSVPDFKAFQQQPDVYFERELPGMYQK